MKQIDNNISHIDGNYKKELTKEEEQQILDIKEWLISGVTINERVSTLALDRKVKDPQKEKRLINKLGQDKYEWAYNIQGRPFPSWTEAFDYAYQLGLKRVNDKAQGQVTLSQADPEVNNKCLK